MTAPAVFAQVNSDAAAEISQKFTESVTQVLQEKIYLHTDKSAYIVGETLWFKAYNVDAATHRLSEMSKVLYVELLNDQGKAVKQEAIRLIDGTGDSQLFITADLHTGMYALRAYTSWMKNFDHDFVFSKTITIINPSTPIPYESVSPADSLFFKFFPEGGHLVNGLPGRLSIHAFNPAGHGEKITGRILDNLQTEIAGFTTSARGLATIDIVPQAGRSYFCHARSKTGDTLTVALPAAKLQGAAMRIDMDSGGNFNIKIGLAGVRNDTFYLVTHTRGILKEIQQLFISDSLELQKGNENFGEGISHLTLMDSKGSVFCERLVFKYPRVNAQLEINKQTFGNREKVKVSVSLNDNEGPLPANASVAVYKIDSLMSGTSHIRSNLLLQSDVKNNIKSPEYYFRNITGEKKQELHHLLISCSWDRFSWSHAMSGQDVAVTHPPEIRAPLLTGRVVDNENDLRKLMISFPGTSNLVNAVEITDDGTFTFEIPFRYGQEKAIFWNPDGILKESDIMLNSPFLKGIAPLIGKVRLTPDLKEMLERRFVDIQIGHAFVEKLNVFGIQPAHAEPLLPFYGTGSLSYNLDDYTRFVDMKELFVEYIKSVRIDKNEGQQRFYNLYQNQPNLILLDGIPLPDADTALAIDPLKIKTIDIINEPYKMGRISFPGIISFITYDGNHENLASSEKLVQKLYHGIKTSRDFFNPDYSTDTLSSDRIPDFRHTLFWKPYVVVDDAGKTEVEFFTSDGDGSYLVEINGISVSGSPFSATKVFKVDGGANKF